MITEKKIKPTYITFLEYRFDVFSAAGFVDQFVALFMHQQLTLNTLEALSAQSPNTVMTKRAKCSLQEKKRKKVN